MNKLISLIAALAFFIVLYGHTPADAFNEKDLTYLAQQTEDSSDKQSETVTDEGLDEAEAEEEDDDEYDEYDDEYAEEEDVELIPIL